MLGHVTGSAVAFAVARVAFMALSATNAVLVAVLLRRSGTPAAVVGGLVYALALPAVYIGSSTAHGGVRPRGAVGTVSVCLPFLLLAGPMMWRMVVLDQLARGGSEAPVAVRVSDLLGLTVWQPDGVGWSTLTVVAAVVVLGCCVLACRRPSGRTAVVLLATTTALLLQVPSWYPTTRASRSARSPWSSARPPAVALPTLASWRRAVAGVVVLAVLAAWAVPGLQRPFGTPFPTARLAAAADVSGCVTSDDPTALLELGALDRDLARRCPVVLDLSGYSYDLRVPGRPHVARTRNAAWQRWAMTYLASGTVTLVVRFAHLAGLSELSTRTVAGWPVVAASQGYDVRRPAA